MKIRETKHSLVRTALQLAMELGVEDLRNVPRCVASGALLDAEEWMNEGLEPKGAVEDLLGAEYQLVRKIDWQRANETMLYAIKARIRRAERNAQQTGR